MSVCCVVGCTNGYKSDNCKKENISFHRFPKDPEIRAAWIWAIKRKDWNPSPYSIVCGKHFEEQCFIRLQHYTVLLAESIPSIFPTYPAYFRNSQDIEDSKGCCFIRGCTYGKRKKAGGQKNLSLFYPPHDSVLLEKWKRLIPKGHAELTSSDRICELHFTEDDIERYYFIKLPDGSVNKIERKKKILKQGAVPNFSNLPVYFTEEDIKMKELIIQNSDDEIMAISMENLENYDEENETNNFIHLQDEENETNNMLHLHNEENGTNSILHLQNEENERNNILLLQNEENGTNSILHLLNEANKFLHNEEIKMNNILHLQNESLANNFKVAVGAIKAPSLRWGINSTPDFIICTKWSATFSPEIKVEIDQDLNAKVFIKEYEIQTDEILSVSTVGDISCLLQQLDDYEICPGVDDKSMTDCRRFMKRTYTYNGRFSSWCKTCQIAKRKLHKVNLQRKRREIKKFRKIESFACAVAKTCPEAYSTDSSFTSTDEHSIDMGNSVVVAECIIREDSCK